VDIIPLDVTALGLARLQFALTAGLHFLFVSLTLGLVPLIAIMQTRYVVTGRAIHRTMTKFWGQLYLINYGMGIITGLVMEFQFGLNWNGLSIFAGNIFGAPIALETLIAFFLESTFLGMWIFGWDRLPKYAHLALIWLVALTAFASAFWIMVSNGFLQHPVGGVVRDGAFQLTDFGALITNKEAIVGMTHLLGGTCLTGGVFVAGMSGWHLARRTTQHEFFLRSLRIGLIAAVLGAALAIHQGFAQFDYLQTDQPGKMAAAFGSPDAEEALHAQFGPGPVMPPSWLSIPANIMQYGGFVLGALAAISLIVVLVLRGRLARVRGLMRVLSWVVPLPFVLVLCGWVVREEGRQPWVVYGQLRTADALSQVSLASVIASFVVFVGILSMLAVIDYVVMRRYARRAPDDPAVDTGPTPVEAGVYRLEL
jgi:cytochrome d ubiquinol oxidase subunit I